MDSSDDMLDHLATQRVDTRHSGLLHRINQDFYKDAFTKIIQSSSEMSDIFTISPWQRFRWNRNTWYLFSIVVTLFTLTQMSWTKEYLGSLFTSYELVIIAIILWFVSFFAPLEDLEILAEYNRGGKGKETLTFAQSIEALAVQSRPVDDLPYLSKTDVLEIRANYEFYHIPKWWPGRKFIDAKKHYQRPSPYEMYNRFWAYDETRVILRDTRPMIVILSLPEVPMLPIGKIDYPQALPASDYINANYVTTYMNIYDVKSAFKEPPQSYIWPHPATNTVKDSRSESLLTNCTSGVKSLKRSVSSKKHVPIPLRPAASIVDENNLDYICSILAEAPKPVRNFKTNVVVERFWLMILQQETHLLVYLDDPKKLEPGQHQYWPGTGESLTIASPPRTTAGRQNGSLEYRESRYDMLQYTGKLYRITQVFENSLQTTTTRRFKVAITEYESGKRLREASPYTITQLHYKDWHDNDTPKGTKQFLSFIAEVTLERRRQIAAVQQVPGGGNPVALIHCDNGVSKSGIFTLLETVLLQIRQKREDRPIAPKTTLQQMRVQRAHLINKPSQYLYCIKTLWAYAKQNCREYWPPDMETSFSTGRRRPGRANSVDEHAIALLPSSKFKRSHRRTRTEPMLAFEDVLKSV